MNPVEEPKPTEAGTPDPFSPATPPVTPDAPVNPGAPAASDQFTPLAPPAPVYTPPAAPAAGQVPPVSPVAPVPGAPAPVGPPKKSKTGLIIGLVVGAVVLLLGTLLTLFIVLPALRVGQDKLAAREVGQNFFVAAKEDDAELLQRLSAPEDRSEADTNFMKNLAAKVGKDCTMQEGVTLTTKEGVQFADTQGACDDGKQTWKIVTRKVEGRWYIDEIVVSGDSAVKTEDTTKKTEPTTQTPSTTAATCVTRPILEELTGFSSSLKFSGAGYLAARTFFFNPDSAEFYTDYVSQQQADLDTYATWIKKYNSLKFTVDLTPQTQESAVSGGGAVIAAQRAEYIKSQLIARGVAADKIIVKAAQAETGSDENIQTARRNVVLEITGDASCE